MPISSDQSAWVLYQYKPGSSPLCRHLESGVDPGNEVGENSRARVNGPKSCRRPVISLSHASKSHRVNRP